MARKPRDRKPALKYTPMPMTAAPISATREEAESHLRAFISNFIHSDRRSRWIHCLLELPEKALGLLHRFEHDQESRCCSALEGSDRFPAALEARYGPERGLYFDANTPPCWMTAAGAATKASEAMSDALLSLVAGSRVLFFHHEGRVWKCER